MTKTTDKETRKKLYNERSIRKVIATFAIAIDNIRWNRLRRRVFISSIIFALVCFFIRGPMWLKWNVFDCNYFNYSLLILAILLFLIIGVVYLCGHPLFNLWVESKFRRIGLTNSIGEPPFLCDSQYLNEDDAIVLTFDSTGIPIGKWQDLKDAIENVFNSHIVDMETGQRMSTVKVSLLPYCYEPRSIIPWDDKYISHEDFVLALGKGLLGVEYADMDIVSHALIAGSTGSGKTVMMLSIVYQCLVKGAFVVLVDFKGGASYPKKLRTHRHLLFIDTEELLNKALDWALDMIERRKQLFADEDCEDISEYNRRHTEPLKRAIIAFDEVAQCFDKNGLSASAKKEIAELEHKMAIIARLGRAFGVHLVLGLQRPDATVITGQIKSNIDLRMCGRCDDTLSMIVLDTTDASREIGEKDRGKFMLGNGHLIQGFFINEENLNFQDGELRDE